MGGLLDFLSPALTVATNAAGAYEGAQSQAAQQKQQAIVQQIAAARQQREQDIKDALTRAQTAHYGLQDQQIQYGMDHPKPIAKKYQYITGPDGRVSAVNEADPTDIVSHLPGVQGKVERQPQEARDQLVQVTGPDGKLHYVWANPQTHTTTPANIDPRQPTIGAGRVDSTHQMAGDHFARAQAASDALDKFGATWATSSKVGNFITGHNPFDSSVQQANQAGEEFATMFAPILNRGRSTHIEIEQVKRSYVPQIGDSPETIRQKSQARRQLLAQYAQYASPGGGALTRQSSAPTDDQRDWDAAVAKYGQARVLKEYGPRPQ